MIPPLGVFVIRVLMLTNKKSFSLPQNTPQDNFIVVFWHHDLLLTTFAYKRLKKPNIDVMISEHFDGEIIAKIIARLGLRSIRGSSSKGGARVFLNALKALRAGADVAITPDGPRGPNHSVSSGVVALATKLDLPIVALGYEASRCWRLKSWDRFKIPKPFGVIDFRISEPFYITHLNEEEAKAKIAKEIDGVSC